MTGTDHKSSRWLILIFVIIISSLPFISIITTPDLPHTSDGEVQLPRLAAYYKALKNGQIPVRWAADLNYGYGMPLFNFMYHIPYLLGSIFLAGNLSLILTFKLVLYISFLLSGIFMYQFSRQYFGNDRTALLVTVLYQFAPFRLVEILIRGAIGGIYAYTFLPLVLFYITKYLKSRSPINGIMISVSVMLLVLSHNSISLAFYILAVIFVLFNEHSIRIKTQTAAYMGLGLGLSAWYFLPAIIEHKYTYGDLFMQNLYREHFTPLINFFIPNLIYNHRFLTAEIATHIGLVHTAVLAIPVLLILKKIPVPNKKLMLWTYGLTVVSLVFMTRVSLPLWEKISWLRQLQFPWRMLAVVCFTTAILGSLFTEFGLLKKRWAYWGLIILIIFSTAFYWTAPRGFEKITSESRYWSYPLDTTYFGETNLIWSDGPAKSYPAKPAEIIGGRGLISGYTKSDTLHHFKLDAKTPVEILDHTQFYPGWKAYVDGQPVQIEFQDIRFRGRIIFRADSGLHDISVRFGETKFRMLTDLISLASALILTYLYLRFLIRNNGRKKTLTNRN